MKIKITNITILIVITIVLVLSGCQNSQQNPVNTSANSSQYGFLVEKGWSNLINDPNNVPFTIYEGTLNQQFGYGVMSVTNPIGGNDTGSTGGGSTGGGGNNPGNPGSPIFGLGGILKNLNITTAQTALIDTAIKQYHNCLTSAIQEIRAAQLTLVQAANAKRAAVLAQLKAGTLDTATARQDIKIINDTLMSQMSALSTYDESLLCPCLKALLAAIQATLTPAQIAAWNSWVAALTGPCFGSTTPPNHGGRDTLHLPPNHGGGLDTTKHAKDTLHLPPNHGGGWDTAGHNKDTLHLPPNHGGGLDTTGHKKDTLHFPPFHGGGWDTTGFGKKDTLHLPPNHGGGPDTSNIGGGTGGGNNGGGTGNTNPPPPSPGKGHPKGKKPNPTPQPDGN